VGLRLGFFTLAVIRGASVRSIKRRRSREARARKVVQGIRQGLKAGHLPDRKKRKGWKKHPTFYAVTVDLWTV
jgi:hypothetical protein